MIPYWSHGERDYYRTPIPPDIRNLWEFQAVLSGSIAPTGPNGEPSAPQSDRLWLFSPTLCHGWTGIPDQSAEIAVFHFETLPEPALDVMRKRPFLSVPLDNAGRRTVLDAIDTAETAYGRQDSLSTLRLRSILDRLSILICSEYAESLPMTDEERAEAVVSRVEAIFRSETGRLVPIEEAAERVGYSEAHLRRLFLSCRGHAPQKAREHIIMNLARRLIGEKRFNILEVALACGYAGHSTFTRAYTRYWNENPKDFRTSIRR